jgi:hypothetical protein
MQQPEGDRGGKARGASDGETAMSRRRLLAGAAGAAAAARALGRPGRADATRVDLPAPASGLPAAQHAWDATLASDHLGNPLAPRHQRLILLDVVGVPDPTGARRLEAVLRRLERRFAWGPDGLLFCLSWSPSYFQTCLGAPSPVPMAIPLAPGETPLIDSFDACLHLAADDAHRLAAVEAALFDGGPLPGADGTLDLRTLLRRRQTRTGFVGAGLPAAHQRVPGIPAGAPVSREAPLFMGYASNRRRNQASEPAVTIDHGPFAGGTTMHVSAIALALAGWYRGLSARGRAARMFAPQLSAQAVARLTTDAPSDPELVDQAARRYGMVGHAQAAAVARRDGQPLILRRDFNTVDGDQAGLHFVALQRTIDDFIATRAAVNAPWAQATNPHITQTDHNGINGFMTVRRRGNYIVPPRAMRAFPGVVRGRSGA